MSDPENPETSPEIPPDLPPGNGNGNGHPRPVRINSVSPIGGVLAGGIDVTITGTGFQPDAEVFFGTAASPQVTFNSSAQVKATVPAATQVGTVSVTLVNSDGSSATRPGAFTYVTTEASLHAEVLGVTPLSVIEDTDSEITIRGRNLIAAFNDGIVVLRGPSRVHLAFSNFSNSRDETTGIELLTLTVRVTATPVLEQHERMAIQVLASIRAGAAGDGVFETSRQMFTVLPRAVPVLLAFSANLVPGKPNLVLVVGKNLKGCLLDLGKRATIHLQNGDDETLAGIVSFPAGSPVPASVELSVLDSGGKEAGRFELAVAPSEDSILSSDLSAEPPSKPPSKEPPQPISNVAPLTLTPVPGQQLFGPTRDDSAAFSLSGQSVFPSFIFFDFEFTILERDIVIPLFNEIRLIPFFDNGVGDVLNNTPVLAEVGKLLRLRGMGLLVALRVDLLIHIEVVLIIGYRFDIGFSVFNEFPEFGWALGSIVISIRVIISVFLLISFLLALVQPGGHLRVLFFFNLVLGIDFTLSTDGRQLHFGTHFTHKVKYTKVSPLHSLLPCDGRFQLAEENGKVAFTDGFGGSQSFYFPRAAGQCCLPWDFELELVRFEEGGPEETVQANFRTEFCLNAAAPTNVVNIIITSEHPAPTGVPRRLVMTFTDRAALKVLAEPADVNGTPTGPPQDITTLGYNVEFYLDPLFPDLFNPTLLPAGDAVPVQAGDSTIYAQIWRRQGEVQFFNFRPDDVVGFVIERFIEQGLLPAVLAGTLPVTVQDPTNIIVIPTLAFVDPQNPNQLTQAPVLFTNQGEVVREIERYEPFEANQLEYVLAVKMSFPTNTSFPRSVKFTIDDFKMMTITNRQTLSGTPPLDGTDFGFGTNREADNDATHFFEKVVQKNQEITINFASRPAANALIGLSAFKIAPNTKDDGQNKLVPPGRLVANREVVLLIDLKAQSTGATVEDIRQLKLAVRNDETYEEYLRVLPEPRGILTGDFLTFASRFYAALPAEGPPTADLLDAKGKELWNLAVTKVQSSVQTARDDRPLYWARLQTICALRAYYKRNRLGQPDVTQFEWPSRGLEQDGSISFVGATAARKVIVTGFDPFQLTSQIDRSNPSGLVALKLNAAAISSTQGNAYVRTAIFPVRYKEFDEGLVEKAVDPNISSIALLMTCSQGRDFYDVERFAGKNRGHEITDNNHLFNTGAAVPGASDLTAPNLSGPEFIESTLPYERVITSDIATRSGPPFSANTPFIVNQHYWILGVQPTQNPGKFRPAPTIVTDVATFEKTESPDATATSREGSGRNFLSNEIFYRTALERSRMRPALPSGHLHVPPLDNQPQTLGPGLLNAVETALVRFLNDKLRLRSLGDVAFPDTGINRTSTPRTLTAQNETNDIVGVAVVEIAPPQGFALQTPLPVDVNPNSVLSLSFTFTPTELRPYASIVRVRDAGGEILFSARLSGKGIPLPPAPVITSFSPTMGEPGDEVMVFGNNLDGASAVRIGNLSVPFTPVDNSQISAEVSGPPRVAPISVDTPGGTAVSAATFRVLRPPRDFGS